MNELFERLAQSKFRSKFKLSTADILYIQTKGIDVIEQHAYNFVNQRLAPKLIPNDGKQTPMKGHPVFIGQHATATCCRDCLYKWHRIPKNCTLTEQQKKYIVAVIMCWINRQI